MQNGEGEDGAERPSALEDAMEMLRQAENLNFHHSPAGTVERDHYDRIAQLVRRLNDHEETTKSRRVYTEEELSKARREVDHRHT